MKKKNLMIAAFAVVSAIFVGCCGTCKKGCDETKLAGDWTVVSIEKEAVEAGDEVPTMNINMDEKRLGGKAGCNSYFASFELGEKCAFTPSYPGATRMMCPDMKVEDAFLAAFGKIKTYSVSDKTLTFYGEGEKEVLSFERN